MVGKPHPTPARKSPLEIEAPFPSAFTSTTNPPAEPLTMRRLPRLRRPLAIPSTSSVFFQPPIAAASPAARTIATTPSYSKSFLQKTRDNLWKEKAPGAQDPYTDRTSDERRETIRRDREQAEYDEYLEDEQAIQAAAGEEPTPSRLILTYERTLAPKPKELTDADYEAAATWDGLEHIGGVQDWWDRPGHWGTESKFTSFAPTELVHDKDVLEVLTRQAVLEILALRAAGQEEAMTALLAPNSRQALDRALSLTIDVREDGGVALEGDFDSVCREVQRIPAVQDGADTAEEVTPQHAVLSPDEARQLSAAWDANWKAISLEDARLKFAVGDPQVYSLRHLLTLL